jgi:hypothetical protein
LVNKCGWIKLRKDFNKMFLFIKIKRRKIIYWRGPALKKVKSLSTTTTNCKHGIKCIIIIPKLDKWYQLGALRWRESVFVWAGPALQMLEKIESSGQTLDQRV